MSNTTPTGFFINVSNPWREAIEVSGLGAGEFPAAVSNPWREAIEEELLLLKFVPYKRFQSLEGGY